MMTMTKEVNLALLEATQTLHPRAINHNWVQVDMDNNNSNNQFIIKASRTMYILHISNTIDDQYFFHLYNCVKIIKMCITFFKLPSGE